jgi:transcriptional regulator GlxA family with amidase domain
VKELHVSARIHVREDHHVQFTGAQRRNRQVRSTSSDDATFNAFARMSGRLYQIDFEKLAEPAGFDAHKLAQMACVCVRHLERHFHERYSTPPQQWLDARRLEVAKMRVTEGWPIKRVAIELGFKQVSHFSRAYSQRHGYSPSQTPARFHAAAPPQKVAAR